MTNPKLKYLLVFLLITLLCAGAVEAFYYVLENKLGIKDKDMIPLCHYHHQGPGGIHHIGKKEWEEKYATQRNLHKILMEDIG